MFPNSYFPHPYFPDSYFPPEGEFTPEPPAEEVMPIIAQSGAVIMLPGATVPPDKPEEKAPVLGWLRRRERKAADAVLPDLAALRRAREDEEIILL